jgi:hypothetical protein
MMTRRPPSQGRNGEARAFAIAFFLAGKYDHVAFAGA